MSRPDSILSVTPAGKWTPEEVYWHLKATFDQAATERPDLFEPFQIRLEGSLETEQVAIMREALGATFRQRWPDAHSRKV